MKRAGWLAIGTVLAALGLQADLPLLAVVALAGLCAAMATALGFARTDGGSRRVALLAVAVGVSLVLIRAAVGMALVPPAVAVVAGGSVPGAAEHQATVLSVGTPSGGLQRAVVELHAPDDAQRVYAWLPRYPPVYPGDDVRFAGRIEPAPADGDFGEYLARSGIAFTCRAQTLQRLGADGSPLAALEAIRRAAAEQITRALPEPQAGLAAAMAIGLRDLVSRDVADDFRAAGLSHVVAISGWHIALVGAVVGGLLGRLTRRRRSIAVLVVIGAYAILAGGSPSVMRAAVMASVVLLARESGRRGQAASALSLTVAAMLLVDPATIADLGFQLSVVATAGLLAWASRLRDWLGSHLPRAAPAWLLEALAVSLAAQAATLPLVLFHFGRLSLVAPLANLLVAPLIAPAMLLTVVALAAGGLIGVGVPALVFAPLTLIGALGVGAMIEIAHLSAGLPFATVDVPPPFNIAAAAGCLALIAYLARRRSQSRGSTSGVARHASGGVPRRRLVGATGTASLCVLLVLVNGARPDGRLHVTVLDIGQGDAILLQGPSGGRMLIDTGPDPDRLLTLLDQRVPVWDRRLDLVVLTHPHEDHVGGLALLLDRYRIGEIVEPGMIGPGPGDQAYRRRLAELGRESRVVAAGDRLWLDGIRLDVDWPRRGEVPLRPADGGTAINNVSIVLELHFGARRMLFTGDVEQGIDPYLLAEGIAEREGGTLDVLKVAHHGSGTATTDAFVESMNPRVAIVSAGWGNPYGHPSPRTVERLEENGARLFRTDLDGSVEISTDGADLLAHADGGRPRPARPSPSPPPGVGFCPIPNSSVGVRRRHTYNRGDADPVANRGRRAAERPRAEREAAQPLGRGGRDCRLHLRGHDPPGSGAQHAARRGRGAGARH